MDPNAALRNMRDIIADTRSPKMAASIDHAIMHTRSDLEAITEQFEALDEWLNKGGFLPADWTDHKSQELIPTHPDAGIVAEMNPSNKVMWLGAEAREARRLADSYDELAAMGWTDNDDIITIYQVPVPKSKEEYTFVAIYTKGDRKQYQYKIERNSYAAILADCVNTVTGKSKGPEKMFLVCNDCGEAFDAIDTATAHMFNDDDCFEAGFSIKPESEAM